MEMNAQKSPLDHYKIFDASWYQSIRNSFSKTGKMISEAAKMRPQSALKTLRTGYGIKISSLSHEFLQLLSPYQRVQITRKIANLAADPRPNDAAPQKGSVDMYALHERHTGFSISYKVHDGVVYILEIVVNPRIKGKGHELPAIYKVAKRNGEWQRSNRPVENVKTTHAAINGQSNVLQRATELMGIHVAEAYKKDNVTEYTLFHNPSDGDFWDTYESSLDKRQKTTAVSKLFSKVLNDIQASSNHVKWVAHSQGGIIFTEGTRYHLENNGGELSNNSVLFHAGANNEKKTNMILVKAKIHIHGYNNHPFDPVPHIVGGNSKDWVSLLGSMVGFAFVFGDNPHKSPHTLPYKGPTKTVNRVYDVKDKTGGAIQAIINSLPL